MTSGQSGPPQRELYVPVNVALKRLRQRAGLTGQEVQSRTKLDLNVVDNGIILDAKLDEHQPQNSLVRLPKQSVSPRRHGGHRGKADRNQVLCADRELTINFSAMSQLDDHYYEPVVFDFGDETVVSDAIFPELAQF